MPDLNQYELSRILNSKLTSVQRPRFGNFGLVGVRAEIARSRVGSQTPRKGLGYKEDALIVQAFEEVRDGAAPDTILWDVKLANDFATRCQNLGLDAPIAVLNRHLINVRKNKGRYLAHGITISPTTKTEPHPSVVPQFAHAIEFSLLRLRYLYGASIDEILLDPALGAEFEKLASSMAPSLTPRDLRLGALYIRKTRHFKKSEQNQIGSLDPLSIEPEWTEPVCLPNITSSGLPSKPGLIELKEANRYLYISKNDDLGSAIEQLATGPAIKLMSNQFWHPNMSDITVRFIAGRQIKRANASLWELRLIQAWQPVFNWPVHGRAA